LEKGREGAKKRKEKDAMPGTHMERIEHRQSGEETAENSE
jgi:hypothetical protein